MSRKRHPSAEYIDGGDVLVKHTDDVELAEKLARALLADREDMEPDEVPLPEGRVIWCRILGALPNSYAAFEGYGWSYQREPGPSRGSFRAVEFVR